MKATQSNMFSPFLRETQKTPILISRFEGEEEGWREEWDEWENKYYFMNQGKQIQRLPACSNLTSKQPFHTQPRGINNWQEVNQKGVNITMPYGLAKGDVSNFLTATT